MIAAGGAETIAGVERRLERRFGKGVHVETPQTKSRRRRVPAPGVQRDPLLLRGDGPLRRGLPDLQRLQHDRVPADARDRDAPHARDAAAPDHGSVLREAALLGLAGAVLGLGLGIGLALRACRARARPGLPRRQARRSSWWAPVAAVATGLLTAVLGALYPARRAGRTSPIRAVLGTEGLRSQARPRRAILGFALVALGLAGAFWLGAAEETTPIVAAAGMTGTIAIFFGIAILAPFVIRPLVRVLSWPVRAIFPVEGRLAAEAARSDPGRTASTATALLIGLALVVAVNSLGSSFLKTISDEFDQASRAT